MKKEDYITAIIGGGLASMLTALHIANHPDYHGKVVLYEKRKMPGMWGAFAANQLHLGLEYALHEQSMSECAVNALIFKWMLPDHCFRPDTTSFMLNRETVNSGKLTVEQFHRRANKNIVEPYFDAFTDIRNYMGWSIREAKENLYGPLDPKKFFQLITDPAYFEKYGDVGGGVVGGFESPQQAFNVPVIGSCLETAIRNHPKIKVICEHAAMSIHPCKDGTDKISFANGDEQFANATIVAAAEGTPKILGQYFPGEITDYYRGIYMLQVKPSFKFDPAFIMEGQNGGMLARYDDNIAFLYKPRYMDLAETRLSASNTTPAQLPDEKILKIHQEKTLEAGYKLFPFLEENVIASGMLCRHTISINGPDLTKRQVAPIRKIGGLNNTRALFSTKATHAAGQSVNVTLELMRDYSAAVGLAPGPRISNNPLANMLLIPRNRSPFVALRDSLRIDPNIFAARDKVRMFIQNGIFPNTSALPEEVDWKIGPFAQILSEGSLQEAASERASKLNPAKGKQPRNSEEFIL